MPLDDVRPGLRPPQFHLRTLMLVVTAVCLLCATFATVGPLAGFALLLAMLIVFAHVAGNALGTQLRENGGPGFKGLGKRHRRPNIPAAEFAPATHLSQHYALGLPNLVSVLIGALLGALAGGVALAWMNWEHLTLAKLCFGAIAFAAIGGMAGFTIGGFVQVAWKTWRHAAHEKEPDAG